MITLPSVDGWLSVHEAYKLGELAEGKNVLEIGSYCGRSTICMAQTAKMVWAVDPFDGRATTNVRDTLGIFKENLGRYGVEHKVTICQGASADVLPRLAQRFDLAFIDGAHDFLSVMCDATLSMQKLDGLLAFHDYRRDIDPGVTAAVDVLIMRGARLVSLTDTLAVLEKP